MTQTRAAREEKSVEESVEICTSLRRMGNQEAGAGERHIGRCKWMAHSKGYGFLIDIFSEEEVFLHYSALVRSTHGWRGLYQNEYVEYTRSVGPTGLPMALHVTGLHGGPLMCEASPLCSCGSNP